MANIGTRIKQKRLEKGLSQEELAKRLGYKSKSTINKIEKGINDITQSNIVKFANALDTTPAYLMGWDQEEIEAASITMEESLEGLNDIVIDHARFVHNMKLWKEEVGEMDFSSDELKKMMEFAKLIVSARK